MKTDRRWQIVTLVVLASVTGGVLVYLIPERARTVNPPEVATLAAPAAATVAAPPQAAPRTAPHAHSHATPVARAHGGELHERFHQAAAMLHIGEHLYALDALERVLELAPEMPEARVNAGFALIGLDRPLEAREQFERAIALRPGQVNAYYGLALAFEALDDIEAALGAMRTYVHLADDGDAHVRRARSAIWEWQSAREREPAHADRSDPDEAADDDGFKG
ncbi:MAG: tetratricopeptide repeat protein [Gammaproteobacteria bacterium]|nr:tetratricopeptide repeat protein [Gammaproteobacteria bacterium]